MNKVAFVFPGQGSQKVGMGYDLFNNSKPAKEVFEEADETLGFPLSRFCFEGPEEKLRQTIFTQPAVMTTSIACLRTAFGKDGIQPAFVAGHSLGEFTALAASETLDFAKALRLVWERAKLMQEAGERHPGGMAAIIGLDEVTLEEICQETGTQIANINSPGQIVISGSQRNLAWAMDLSQARGARRVIRLGVSGAFHSILMQPAAESLGKVVSEFEFQEPKFPVVVNVTGRPEKSPERLRERLIQQLLSPVLWQPSVEYMIEGGVSTFIEIGPGKVLAGLIRRISKEIQVINLNDLNSTQALNLQDR